MQCLFRKSRFSKYWFLINFFVLFVFSKQNYNLVNLRFQSVFFIFQEKSCLIGRWIWNKYFLSSIMMTTVLSIFLGSCLTSISISFLILNLAVLYVLYKGKFLSSNRSPIYLFAFANILGNTLTLTIFGFYFGPSCILQVYNDDNKKLNDHTTLGFSFSWRKRQFLHKIVKCFNSWSMASRSLYSRCYCV